MGHWHIFTIAILFYLLEHKFHASVVFSPAIEITEFNGLENAVKDSDDLCLIMTR